MMRLELMLFFLCLMSLLACSREVPLDEPAEEKKKSNNTSIITEPSDIEWDAYKTSRDNTNNNTDLSGRSNHSRMLLKTTTFEYDDWWFLTTGRPVSYKDFPGKIGVATWKEISPGFSENKKSKTMPNPTAAGVASNSWTLLTFFQHTILCSLLGIVLFL